MRFDVLKCNYRTAGNVGAISVACPVKYRDISVVRFGGDVMTEPEIANEKTKDISSIVDHSALLPYFSILKDVLLKRHVIILSPLVKEAFS